MILTDEQINSIGDYYFDDLPFCYEDIDQKKFWNALPSHIQTDALLNGANDTLVRENIYEYLLETQLNLSYDLWIDKDENNVYTHELAEALFGKKEPVYIELDYTKFK